MMFAIGYNIGQWSSDFIELVNGRFHVNSPIWYLGSNSITWINFDPSMEKWPHA